MTAMEKFYLDRADEARLSAASALLLNVRDRHLLAEATWSRLALRAGRVQAMHEERVDTMHATRLANEAALAARSIAEIGEPPEFSGLRN
jgi:hypothetical protein